MASLLSWLGRKIKLTDGAFWSLFFSGETYAGKSVNVDSALSVSTFWACVKLLSQTVATLPLPLYKYQKDSTPVRDYSHQIYRVIHDQPNADHTAVEFWEGMVASMCVWGNSFAEKLMNSSGVIGLQAMATTDVTPFRDSNGALRYRFNDRGRPEELPEEKVFHLRGFGFGGDLGLSVLAYARQTLGTAMATDESAARTFSNGMRPSGFFTYDKTLTPAQRDQARKVLVDPYAGSENAHKVGILEAGFKWQDVMMPPEDAQMLQTRAFHVEEICRWFGVPPILVGHASAGQTMWGSGVEQIMLGWLTLGLSPWLKRIERRINMSLLSPAEQTTHFAEFIVEGLLRADSTARANLYGSFATNGIMSRNEIRAKENLPAMPGGDELTIQAQLVPIDRPSPPRAEKPKLEVVR